MLSTLEVLYAAKARLQDETKEFHFPNWKSCTCGHIYAAATGRRASDVESVYGSNLKPLSRKTKYAPVIQAVAAALGWNYDPSGYPACPVSSAAGYVSDFTLKEAPRPVEREHAVAVIDKAIAAIEAQQEQDRRDVLAQTAAVIDSAAIQETARVLV